MSGTVFFLSLGVVFCVGWFGLPHLWRLASERRLARMCQSSGTIVLTYDDGPSASLSGPLLALLSERNVKATFFLVGEKVALEPGLAQRFVAEGHEVGSHTFDHINAWKALPHHVAIDIRRGVGAVGQIGGDGAFFRPPYGKVTIATLLLGWFHRFRFAWWTVDSRDSWARRDVSDILAEIDRRKGGVILMHDFDRPGPTVGQSSHKDYVLDLTERIIDHAAAHGYRMNTLGDVIGKAP
ncbi:MAG: polysaccharide deacetylase family protein [Pseudomonadota bacterium]